MASNDPARTESYWQRGCNDARAGQQPSPPNPTKGKYDLGNRGYMAGYRWGDAHRYEPTADEGSQP